ncbi:MAG TPA: hypothetical protein VG672_26715, partial [Bryobacteraceae bacterium]|nr:hypothetical protein [Bryobacteraceae bacterium]
HFRATILGDRVKCFPLTALEAAMAGTPFARARLAAEALALNAFPPVGGHGRFLCGFEFLRLPQNWVSLSVLTHRLDDLQHRFPLNLPDSRLKLLGRARISPPWMRRGRHCTSPSGIHLSRK